MTKVFVIGAPGSGIVRVAEELYMRDDFKKTFSQDPVYKRINFSNEATWSELCSIIKTNYQPDQAGEFEIHSGWWLYHFFDQIAEEYPDSIFIFVSRHNKEILKKIALNGNQDDMIARWGGPEMFKDKIEMVDKTVENIASRLNSEWKIISSDMTIFGDNFSIVSATDDAKPASMKIAVGKN